MLFQNRFSIKDGKEVGVCGRAGYTCFRNLALNGIYRMSHIGLFELDFKGAKL